MKIDKNRDDDLSSKSMYKIATKAIDGVHIVHTNDALHKYTEYIYAVCDPLDEHRVFIGIAFRGNYTSIFVSGLFVYFDNNTGNVSKINVIDSVLCNYDWRNGRIDESNTYLYNQTLLMTQSHRDSGNHMITLCCFNYEDGLLGIYTDFSDIKVASYVDNCPTIQQNRWLLYTSKIQYVLIDLGSVCCIEQKEDSDRHCFMDKKEKICYSEYRFDKVVNIEETVNALDKTTLPQLYNDGYLPNCVKCGNRVENATLYANSSQMCYGGGYCHVCRIRYSKSTNAWVCCKFELTDDPYRKAWCCSAILTPENGYMCENEHIDAPIKYKTAESHYKPYKNISTIVIEKQEEDRQKEDEEDEDEDEDDDEEK